MTFEEIYQNHFEFVWRTLQRMGVCDRDAPDACQKVFLIAFRRLADFEGRSTLRTWLCGIALRVASDYRRSAVQRREVLLDADTTFNPSDPLAMAELERREQLHELDAVLAQLPDEQRAVLVLFELEEMSGEDIARTLAIPEGTVRSRLRLARQAFSRIADTRRQGFPQAAGGTHD
ncbi:MAG TPA: RNA polymerase sigma factor [Polyangiaceae bacterium]|nr:RNA polymerase sigma factor [Polyangiaceae bacterium]